MRLAAAERPAVLRMELLAQRLRLVPLRDGAQHVARVVEEEERARHLRQDQPGEAAYHLGELVLAAAALQAVRHAPEEVDGAAARLHFLRALREVLVGLAQLA